jgi:orotidine-5'-phosphate decarboxylase
MYVVGATKAEYFTEVRKIVPNSFISARSRSTRKPSEVCKYGMNDNIGLLINSSRGIFMLLMGLILPQKPDKRQSKCNRKWKELLV